MEPKTKKILLASLFLVAAVGLIVVIIYSVRKNTSDDTATKGKIGRSSVNQSSGSTTNTFDDDDVPDEADLSTCNPSLRKPDIRPAAIIGGRIERDHTRHPTVTKLVFPRLLNRLKVCSGTLIDDRHILTLGICVLETTYDDTGFVKDTHLIQVYLNNVSVSEATVEAVFLHPAVVNPIHSVNTPEIAVLRLNRSLSSLAGWGYTIKPVCLPAEGTPVPRQCRIFGWGITDPKNVTAYPTNLHSVNVTAHGFQQCVNFQPFSSNKEENLQLLDNSTVCSDNGENADRGFCFGDLGGPLLCKEESTSQVMQFGINAMFPVDTNAMCLGSRPGFASVYVSVPYYRSWLKYVALEALKNVSNTKTKLNCLQSYCRNKFHDVFEKPPGKNYSTPMVNAILKHTCIIFAGYVYCVRKEVKPLRCKTTAVPAFFLVSKGRSPDFEPINRTDILTIIEKTQNTAQSLCMPNST